MRLTAVVTGAGSAIGSAIAEALARDGYHVVLAGRTEATLEQAHSRVHDVGGESTVLVGDITESDWTQRLLALGPIGIYVGSASAHPPYGRVDQVTDNDLRQALEVGLVAVLRHVRAVLPGMREAGWGRIVTLGSHGARSGARGLAAYTTAKAGLAGLVRTIAAESGAHGITANLVEVGFVDTPRTRASVRAEVAARLVAHTAVARAGTPAEIAAVVRFLASPEASFVTGATIPVTGGLHIGLMPRS